MEPSKTLLAPPDVDRFCVLLTHSEVVGALRHTIYNRMDVIHISFHDPLPHQSFYSGAHTFPW